MPQFKVSIDVLPYPASRRPLIWAIVPVLLLVATQCSAQEKAPNPPQIVGASGEGDAAISQFKYPAGLKCRLFASEPDVANIVALHQDYAGRLFVCETFRQESGVEDNRRHAHWMDEELQAQTVQDRIDYIRKYIPDADETYTANDDRIRVLLDQDGDGKADKSKVFSDRYNRIDMGTGAGVLSYRDNVYYTCIPDLFLLKDRNGDNVADERSSLHTGFGVRFAFRGHDMHGLIVGPDGRLYFSIGDRGYNVSPGIKDPTSGAVFRCELDGSNLEVVCTGLRNPQELAFDNYGNLFTGDNNSDSGDMARWVYLVPGGDTGWRMYYQYLDDRGPFNREKIWHPYSSETPAYIIPPITNISDGPSGLEFYPGTGFGDEFNDRFFLCDFRGVSATSGIRSFKNQPDGAFFKLVEDEQPFWNILATDLDFGSDGKLYVSDWVFGWDGENKGRVYTFASEEHADSPVVKEVETLLREGLSNKGIEELTSLLGHADRRIRQEAQFALVEKGQLEILRDVAISTQNPQLMRIHAVWGLSQLARNKRQSLPVNGSGSWLEIFTKLIGDNDPEVRAQAVKMAWDGQLPFAASFYAGRLKDESRRVRYFAATGLADAVDSAAEVESVAMLLEDNDDVDPILRHGGIMALKGMISGDGEESAQALSFCTQHSSSSVRLATSVAIRKALSAELADETADQLKTALAGLLQDADQSVFVETVRVIHDLPVNDLMSALAAKITDLEQRINGNLNDDAIIRRLINANLRSGQLQNAQWLAEFAANSKFPLDRRKDAIQALQVWMDPPPRDPVLNDWRPVNTSSRKLSDAQKALVGNFAKFTKDDELLASAAIEAAGSLKIEGIEENLTKVVLSPSFGDATRSAALVSVSRLDDQQTTGLLQKLSEQFSQLPNDLAATVADETAKRDSQLGLKLAQKVLARMGETTIKAKQAAIATIGIIEDEVADRWLLQALDDVSETSFPSELRLDVVMASQQRTNPTIKNRLAKYREKLAASEDPAMVYADTLNGGDEEKGKQIFYGKTEVSCVRCHRIDGTGGKVGPDLSGTGLKNDRKYLLDSLVNPNKAITEGYGQVKVQTIDGLIFVGIVKSQTDSQLQLLDADGKKIIIPQDDIEGVKPGLSAMPDDLVKQLSQNEIRDLVEYLSRRKTPVAPAAETSHERP